MKLITISFEGYRRFEQKQSLHVAPRLVALLGPNEAGKTSLLRGISKLNGREPFVAEGPEQDLSRKTETKKVDHPLVTAKFFLEESDSVALREAEIPNEVRWFIVGKRVDGRLTGRVEPKIEPDKNRIFQVLEKVRQEYEGYAKKAVTNSSDRNNLLDSAFLSAFTVADKRIRTKNISNEDAKVIFNLAVEIDDVEGAGYEGLSGEIKEVFSETGVRDLNVEAIDILLSRAPDFLMFSEQDRGLSSSYDLSSYFREKNRQPIPKALRNLAAAAALNLGALFEAMQSKDEGKIETFLVNANDSLTETLEKSWSQGRVSVKLRLNNSLLSILVGSKSVGFESISERSDGLRQFIALFSFISQERGSGKKRDIILLIDEVESHLHYDAQADLIQMLSRQNIAKKIIYTTHSLGCLPEDLGCGISLVQPNQKDGTSRIVGKFWADGGIGFSPILFGAGAVTMAFLPVRYSILAEGPADMLLLPVLIRQAMKIETVGYQIAPGISQAAPGQVGELSRQGSRVLFLVDGDEGGRDMKKKLLRAGVDEEKIFELSEAIGRPSVVEDLVSKEIYVEAINEELARSGVGFRLEPSDLGEELRPSDLRAWCKEKNIEEPSKVNVAYNVLDKAVEQDVFEEALLEKIRALHRNFLDALEGTNAGS